jgi:hypothetical protein
MKAVLLIFGGISFPYRLTEKAVAWAKTNGAALQTLFIVGKETEEGYPFPSDLDAAESLTDKDDVVHDDVEIIRSQMKFISDNARAEKININSEILIDPSFELVMAKISGAKILFINATYQATASLSDLSFDIRDLVDHAPCPVEEVSEN